MSDLIADVVNGQVDISESSQKKERNVGSQLGKEDFLLLLVTQMKYQDPLEPTDNTEYVSQLAQFSELEYMQNMSDVTQHTSAFSLVGKYVYVQTTSEGGHTEEAEGVVDYVTMKNGDAYVSVNGMDFSYDDIVEVRDEAYIIAQKSPQVVKQSILFLHHDAQDVVVRGVDLGEDEYGAYSMGIGIINEKGETYTIDPEYVKYSEGVVTIDKKAFAWLDAGTYNLAFVFDDPNKTVDYESVTLTVKGIATAEKPDNTQDTEGSDDDKTDVEGKDDSTDKTGTDGKDDSSVDDTSKA